MSRLVYGIGTNDRRYPTCEGNTSIREYRLWKHMLYRCTESLWIKYPTYTGTTCSENFKSYSFFYEWCQTQVGFRNIDDKNRPWEIDKDVLVKGNKVYSEDTCVFIPHKINSMLTKAEATRGEQPIGVYKHTKANIFQAACRGVSGSTKAIGVFDSAEKAFKAYKVFKESCIKQVAEKYKHLIDNRAYQALMNYEVNEND